MYRSLYVEAQLWWDPYPFLFGSPHRYVIGLVLPPSPLIYSLWIPPQSTMRPRPAPSWVALTDPFENSEMLYRAGLAKLCYIFGLKRSGNKPLLIDRLPRIQQQ